MMIIIWLDFGWSSFLMSNPIQALDEKSGQTMESKPAKKIGLSPSSSPTGKWTQAQTQQANKPESKLNKQISLSQANYYEW